MTARINITDRKETIMNGMIRQGDVLLIPVASTPDNLEQVPREGDRLILAHGEATGHAHAIAEHTADLVTAEQADELYLLVHGTDPVSLVHDEHSTLTVVPGSYRVVRQREYTSADMDPVQVED